MNVAPEERPLADTLDAARAHAERHFGDGPVPTWQPKRRWEFGLLPLRRPWMLRVGGGLAIAALLATVWWARERVTAPAPLGAPVALEVEAAAPAPVAAPALQPVAATTVAAPVLNIARRGTRWQIHAVGASRLAAAQVLAELSGSTLHGQTALLATTRPLHLHQWQGGSQEAWQAVLGAELSYALQCDARGCRAWIVDGATPGTAVAMPAAEPAPPVAPPPVGFTGLPTAAVAPSDSADPRVAAHHD